MEIKMRQLITLVVAAAFISLFSSSEVLATGGGSVVASPPTLTNTAPNTWQLKYQLDKSGWSWAKANKIVFLIGKEIDLGCNSSGEQCSKIKTYVKGYEKPAYVTNTPACSIDVSDKYNAVEVYSAGIRLPYTFVVEITSSRPIILKATPESTFTFGVKDHKGGCWTFSFPIPVLEPLGEVTQQQCETITTYGPDGTTEIIKMECCYNPIRDLNECTDILNPNNPIILDPVPVDNSFFTVCPQGGTVNNDPDAGNVGVTCNNNIGSSIQLNSGRPQSFITGGASPLATWYYYRRTWYCSGYCCPPIPTERENCCIDNVGCP